MTHDNERILMQLRGVPAKTMTRLEAMMDHPANPQTFEANDNDRRVAELEAERPLLLQALWMLLDGVEVVVRPEEGKRAISITAMEDGGSLIRRARAALSQEEKP